MVYRAKKLLSLQWLSPNMCLTVFSKKNTLTNVANINIKTRRNMFF